MKAALAAMPATLAQNVAADQADRAEQAKWLRSLGEDATETENGRCLSEQALDLLPAFGEGDWETDFGGAKKVVETGDDYHVRWQVFTSEDRRRRCRPSFDIDYDAIATTTLAVIAAIPPVAVAA